jgi:hypothetical protein
MSRAYRIRVQESLRRRIAAEDAVCTQLELLEVLPPEQMADLLRNELKRRGFEDKNGQLVRDNEGLTATIDPTSGEVTIRAQESEQLDLAGQREGIAYDDVGPNSKNVQKALGQRLRKDLEKQAEHEQSKLQTKATERLAGALGDLEKELSGVVNRVTAQALKQKAAQIGQIKEMTEDPETGSLTIKVEV